MRALPYVALGLSLLVWVLFGHFRGPEKTVQNLIIEGQSFRHAACVARAGNDEASIEVVCRVTP